MQGASHCTKQGFPQQTSPVASSHSFHTSHEMNQQTPNAPLQCHVLSTAEMNPSDAAVPEVMGKTSSMAILPPSPPSYHKGKQDFLKKKKLCFCKYFELPFLVENKSLLSINLRTSSLPLLIPITVLSFHFCAYITARDITAIAICEQNPHPGLSKAEHTCIQLLLSQQGSAYSSRIFPKCGALRNSSRLRWRFLSNTSKAELVSQLWRSIAEWEPTNPPLKAREENGVTLAAGGTNQERKWKSWKELEEYKGKYKEKEMSQTMRLIPS